MNNQNNNTSRVSLLKRIQEEEFAVYETVLYLDGYPDDKEAFNYYITHLGTLKELRESYKRSYGPLNFLDELGDVYNRNDSLWPWQKGAN